MTLAEFKESVKGSTPPDKLDPLLKALWHDAKGNWEAAHDLAQDVHTNEGSWMHAYLHRKEGDPGNAAYWYRRANRPVCTKTLEEEWKDIVKFIVKSEE